MNNNLPTFIIIGAMKAGTTSLHDFLRKHPEIYMPENKEIDYYFLKSLYQKGIEWYKSNFCTEKKIIGEASPNYSKGDHIPQLIFNDLPDVKLIYIIRDPIERLISEMRHLNINISALNNTNLHNNKHVKNSMYFQRISTFLHYFKKEQICILVLENLEKNAESELKKLYKFLGVSTTYISDDNTKIPKLHQTKHKISRKKYFEKLRKTAIISNLKKIVPIRFYNKLFRDKIIGKLFFKTGRPEIVISPELKQKLFEVLKPEMLQIQKQFDIDLTLWSNFWKINQEL